MEFFAVLWDYVLPFLIVLTVLVFVHELGHYWVARRCGVRVEVFSIGFGPEIVGWTDKADTRWKISAIPLGGYVKMFGEGEMSGEDEVPRPLTPAERQVSFRYKSLGSRAAIVFAGPAANFIFAVIVLAGLFVSLDSLSRRRRSRQLWRTAPRRRRVLNPVTSSYESTARTWIASSRSSRRFA